MRDQKERDIAVNEFLEAIETAYIQMRPNLPQEWLVSGLSTLQFRIITLLSRGSKRVSDLAVQLHASPSSVTHAVDYLVDKELVERVPHPVDRRAVVCRLTTTGARQVQYFWHINRRHLEELARNLTIEEIETVVRALRILKQASPVESLVE